MRPGVILCNAARGPLVDEAALTEALESGHLGGGALDVLEVEPLAAGSPLRLMDDVFLTPHIAGRSEQARANVLDRTAADIRRVLAGHEPVNVVNARDNHIESDRCRTARRDRGDDGRGGFDRVRIDTQHGVIGYDEMVPMPQSVDAVGVPMASTVEDANRRTIVAVVIETPGGVTPTLKVENPEHEKLIDRVLDACRRRGVVAGVHCDGVETVRRWHARGDQGPGDGPVRMTRVVVPPDRPTLGHELNEDLARRLAPCGVAE